MLKALFALCILQTVVLFFLASRVIMLDEGVATVRTTNSAIDRSQVHPSAQQSTVSVSAFPIETRLREIIREELASQLDGIAFAQAGVDLESVNKSDPTYERRRDSVGQSVDYYVSTGTINEQDMAHLQQEIARLNPEDRMAMLSKIVSAMNGGQLDGRF